MEVNEEGLLVLSATGWDKVDYGKADEEAKYAITGTESQVLTMKLNQGETLCSEPGVFMYRTGGIEPDTQCEGCFGRCCAGESCCSVNYTNTGGINNEIIAITPNFPTAKVVPVDLVSVSLYAQYELTTIYIYISIYSPIFGMNHQIAGHIQSVCFSQLLLIHAIIRFATIHFCVTHAHMH